MPVKVMKAEGGRYTFNGCEGYTCDASNKNEGFIKGLICSSTWLFVLYKNPPTKSTEDKRFVEIVYIDDFFFGKLSFLLLASQA